MNEQLVVMRCPACGRSMIKIGSQMECTNSLCDYKEDFEEVKDEASSRD